MSSSLTARRGATAALAVFAAAALFLVGLAQGSADAATVIKGSAVVKVNSLKSAKASAIAPAKGKKVGRKGVKATAPVKSLNIIGRTAKVGLRGGIKLSNGKRSLKIKNLSLAVNKRLTVVRGKLGGKNIVVFTANGKAKVNPSAKTVKLTRAKLKLPASVAKKVKKKLKLRKVPRGKVGVLSVTASKKTTTTPPVDPCEANPSADGCEQPLVDPYLEQCGVDAVVKLPGTIAPAGDLPSFTNDAGAVGPTSVAWGFKSSFRSYVTTIAGGSIHALDNAATTGSAPSFSGFEFPSAGFRYTDNGTPDDLADDKAVLEGSGTALFCATGHGFRVALSNPAVVIDGGNSRIDADVDANLSGNWIPTQRVTIASLKVGAATRTNEGTGSAQSWDAIPAKLTAEGSQAICGTGDIDKCSSIYPAGTALDPITVKVSLADPVSVTDPYAAECGVPATGYTGGRWADASALPEMTGSLATTSPTSISWGFRTAFRGYVYGAMADAGKGASALQALDGASRTMPPGDPTRGFTFPVSNGEYAANNGTDTADDQAVINGTGTALFCNSAHGFWIKVSNPTVVIDGANSRIVAEISANESGVWSPNKTVDLADLDLSGVTPIYNKSGSEVTWGDIPATLSAEAAPFGQLAAGVELDPVTVAVKTAYDTGAGDSAAWNDLATYVSTNLPFPNTDPTTGGCTLPVPAGGNQGAARTVDEYLALGAGTTYQWYANPAKPAALPTLNSASDVTTGQLDWGIRSGLRSTTNAGGRINLSGGTTASTDYYGNGGTLTAPFGSYGAGMGAAAAFFSWPSATSAGQFDAGNAGTADDRLVLRTKGTVGLCNDATTPGIMLYGTVVSNPTVVIDGANSRIVADVATRYRLSWVRATVDLVSFDATSVTPTVTPNGNGTTTETWAVPAPTSYSPAPGVGPVKITAAGEKVLRMMGATTYYDGVVMDSPTISVTYPTPGA